MIWSVYSIYYIHTMYCSCILDDWNKLFLRDMHRVGAAITACRMIRYWYCYSFLLSFKYIFQLYSSGLSILGYGYRHHVTLCIGQLHLITVCRTGFRVCDVLVLSVSVCSFYLFLDRVLFYHDGCDNHLDFYCHPVHFEIHIWAFCY